MVKEFPLEFILLDLVMPGKDGGELRNDFESDPTLRDGPFIMLSALAAHCNTDGVRAISGYPLVAEPMKMDELIACIQSELGRSVREGLA